MVTVGVCEKCGKSDTYTAPWKGRNLCFECTLAARHPKTYKITGTVEGTDISTYKEANSESEAILAYREDFPNAQNIDVHKL